MVNKYVGAAQFVGEKIIKPIVKSFTKKTKTTGTEVVNPFKFKPSKSKLEKAVKKLEIDTAQQKGKTKKIIQKMENEIEPFRRKLRQTTQKVAGEKVTKSGFSKGKNIKPKKEKGKVKTFIAPKDFNKGGRVGKMGGGMMGRRFGMKKGSKKFPDLTGDGKVTFADILKGRGVINGKKKGKK